MICVWKKIHGYNNAYNANKAAISNKSEGCTSCNNSHQWIFNRCLLFSISKPLFSIEATENGIVTLVRLKQNWKVPSAILVIPLGIVTFVKPLQP